MTMGSYGRKIGLHKRRISSSNFSMADIVRKNISLYPQHVEWIEDMEQKNDDFNFSEWVREQIEEEGGETPAFIQ